jgi:hypothetical protein
MKYLLFALSLAIVASLSFNAISPVSAQTTASPYTAVLSWPDEDAQQVGATGQILVTLKSSRGTALPGKVVRVQTSFASAAITPTQATTDGNGQAIFKVRSTRPGTATFRVRIDPETYIQPDIQVNFVQTISPSLSTVIAEPKSLIADNDHQSKITVLVKDKAGNPIYNKPVMLRGTNSISAVISPPVNTDDAGRAIFYVRSANPGELKLQPSISETLIDQIADIIFTPRAEAPSSPVPPPTQEPTGAPPADQDTTTTPPPAERETTPEVPPAPPIANGYTFSASKDSGLVGEPITFTATLRNAAGAPIANKTIVFNFRTENSSWSNERVSDSNGTVRLTYIPTQIGSLYAEVGFGDATLSKYVRVYPATTETDAASPPPQDTNPTSPTTNSATASSRNSSLDVDSPLTQVGKTVTFILTLANEGGQPLADRSAQIIVSIRGENTVYSVTTNAGGQARVQVKATIPGGITATAMVDRALLIRSVTVENGTSSNPTGASESAPPASTYQEPQNPTGAPAGTETSTPSPAQAEQAPATTASETPAPAPVELKYVSGKFVWNSDQRKLTYKNPRTGKTLAMWEARWAFNALKEMAQQIPETTLTKIPVSGSNSRNNMSVRKSFAGFILQGRDKKRIWYVNPKDLKRYYFDGSAKSFEYLKKLGM